MKTTPKISHYSNPQYKTDKVCPKNISHILSLQAAENAYREISSWPDYEVTPLHRLDGLANQLSVAEIWYKDEAGRFGLGSFKALGGAYAVFMLLKQQISSKTGQSITIHDLLARRFERLLTDTVVTCATDGNHGRSVAWGAQLFGCKCVIYIHRDVSEARQQAIEDFGADVVRISGNYDDSVRKASEDAVLHGRIIISDTSYENYVDVPKTVSLGYTVMFKEIVDQLRGHSPTHIFVQGGVGGLAAAICAYFWQVWPERRPRLIVVEPESANCLQESARLGAPAVVEGDLNTIMAGLACGEVSLLAWEILSIGCSDFMTISEDSVVPCMQILAEGRFGDEQIVAGESAVAGLAALIGSIQNEPLKTELQLSRNSRVLVIGTEGATDQALYDELLLQQSGLDHLPNMRG